MAIIQCAENCKYQFDGYCNLEKCSTVNLLNRDCPYFLPRSADIGNCLFKTPDTYKFK